MAAGHRYEGERVRAREEEAALRASERARIPSFLVMDVMARAAALEAEGRSIVHMEVGQPGTSAPRLAREAVRAALDRDTLGYTLALGSPALRQRIARHYRERYDCDVDPERVVVTTGSSGAFVLAFLALFEAGRRVALPSPGYPCYRHILTALGVEHALVETGPSDRWMPTAASLAAQYAATPLAGVLLASPANPTGTMATPERLAEIAAFCRECGLWLVSDEIYHGLDYGVRAETALRYADEAVVINSFSKYYSMTGWRVGWMVVPASLVRPVERLAQNLFISPPAVAQVAAAAAFDALEELEANRQVYAANRDMLLESLPRLGLERFAPPDGAFYVYLDVGHLTDDSQAFAGRLLTEAGVAATPGIDFDPVHGRGYLRLCYAGTPAEVAEALKRLSSWPGLRGRGP